MTLGSKWRCVRVSNQDKDTGVREIGKVQTNAVAFVKADGKLSWLGWPTANRYSGTHSWNSPAFGNNAK